MESHEQPQRDRLAVFLEVYDDDPCPSVGRQRYYLLQKDFHGIDKRLLDLFGFASKKDFIDWRSKLNYNDNRRVEWTAGFLFKFYDDDHHYTLVDKNGKEPKRFI
jgi:hypothetical protein